MVAQNTTGEPYAASDGVGGIIDGVVVQNLLLITSAVGEDAALIGSLYNDTETPVAVEMTVEDDTVSFTIPAMSTVTLGLADGDEELITTTTIAPGLTSQVTITLDKSASRTKPLPVLDGTLPEYRATLEALEAKST